MKPYISRLAIILAAISSLFHACAGSESSPIDEIGRNYVHNEYGSLEEWRGVINECFARHEYETTLRLGTKLRDLGTAVNDGEAYLSGLVCVGQSYLCLGQFDSMQVCLNDALALAEKLRDNWSLSMIYNCFGIYSVFTEMDYYQGISYLIDAVKYAELCDDPRRLFAPKGNLALAYYLRNDPSGLGYALDVYELGKKYDDLRMVFSGAVTSAYMYYILENYGQVLKYIEEAVPLAEIYGDKRGVFSLYADVLRKVGREEDALVFYRKALADDSVDGYYSGVDAHLSYGTYLMDNQRYEEAVDIMEQGIDILANANIPVQRYLLYRNISAAYESLGNPAAALEYYKLYHEEADSIFNADKERSIGELKVRYEKERHAGEVRQHELDMISWRKRLHVTLLLLALVLIIAISGYILNYRKDRNYRQILKQHQEALDKERWYRQQLEKYSGETGENAKYHSKSASNDKMEELFSRLQELMRSEELYKTHDLGRDKVAKMLSTNRTYLTETIKSFTGLSFIYYVNSFRIDEAVRVLSDPEDDTPIKALASELGFSSLSTFYKFFQAATGMPPSQFRENRKSA